MMTRMRGLSFILPISVGLAVLIVYALTICPTVPGGDSGELIAVAHTLGVAHPPGYPLFTLVGFLADRLLWFGEPALRINLVSSCFGALSAALVFVICRQMTRSVSASLFASVLFAFTPVVWTYASVAEVFTLNTALCLAAIAFLARWRVAALVGTSDDSRGSVRPAALFVGLFLGLALANHHTALFVLLATALTAIFDLVRGQLRRTALQASIVPAALGLLLGLAPYAYLPLAAGGESPVQWGEPDSFSGFVRHILRSDYGTLRLVSAGIEDKALSFYTHPLLFLTTLAKDTFYIGLALGLLGMVSWLRRSKGSDGTAPATSGVGLPCLLSFVGSSFVFLGLVNAPLDPPIFRGVVARFYILPIAFLAIFAGYGLDAWLAHARQPLQSALRIAVCALAPIALIAAHHHEADQSENYVARDLGTNILRSLPPNAVLFCRSDLVTNALAYQQHVLDRREDVLVADQELLTYEWYVRRQRQRQRNFGMPGRRYDGVTVLNVDLIRGNEPLRPVFFFGFKEQSYTTAYVDEPHGLVRRIVPKDNASTVSELLATNERLLDMFETRTLADPPFDPTTFEHEAMRHYALFFLELGRLAAGAGKDESAVRYLGRAEALAPDLVSRSPAGP